MEELVKKLNDATRAYDEGNPIMSDGEWDKLYFELAIKEARSGYHLPDSPIHHIDFQVVSSLEKVKHDHPMLSLAKTKEVKEIVDFIGSEQYICMAKMDGLTCSLTYEDGKLIGAETRGDGIVGENVLHNAGVIPSIPRTIDLKGKVVVDGEIICKYDDFHDWAWEYKNPRNFAAGSIRLLDSGECAARSLTFIAWDWISGFDMSYITLSQKLIRLFDLGFKVVPFVFGPVLKEDYFESIKDRIVSECDEKQYPIDGLVYKYDLLEKFFSCGRTDHHFKGGMAFKFEDEVYDSNLKDIEWTMGRTGVLTPVAVFNSIEMDGSMVERASLHNLGIMRELLGFNPYKGQPVKVYKANMIIPQIFNSEIHKSETDPGGQIINLPEKCPVCGGEVRVVKSDSGTLNLTCINDNCEGKLINRLDHFCGKSGLDIKGLSKATLEKLMDWGWVKSIGDIFQLEKHKTEWVEKPGFGEKSVGNVLSAIDTKRKTSLEAFISSLGIPLIGKTVSREIVKHINSYEEFRDKVQNHFDFSEYDGFADSKTEALWSFDYTDADEVYQFLEIEEKVENSTTDSSLDGVNVVITGRLEKFKNRSELVSEIERRGGKVAGSVSGNTKLLINNDNTSKSAKNIAAQKLGIPVLTEQEFCDLYLT